MHQMVVQQKQIFEEYTQKVSAVMQQLEIENSELRMQQQSTSELRAQINASKQNVAKILDDAVLEKKRADQAIAKNKDYKMKLAELVTQMGQLQTTYQQQQGLVESQAKFIGNVLQICKVQTCAHAVEYLSDIHRKADFYSRTSELIQTVCSLEPFQSVKESWRRTKELISSYCELTEQYK